jgi:hypothetical protein
MRIIDEHRPDFMYSLHNAGFCGVYWYLGEEVPALYPRLHELAREQGLPIHRGEPETPYIEKFDEAIFRMTGAEDWYNFTEKHTDVDPATLKESGTSSHGYLRSVCDGFTLVCEMPYYFDGRVTDDSPSDVGRREAVLEALGHATEAYEFLRPRFEAVAEKADASKRLYQSVYDHLANFEKRMEPRRRHAETAEEYEGRATVAQAFDSRVARRYGTVLMMGMAMRVADDVLSVRGDKKIEEIRDEIHGWILETNREVERRSDIEVIPIQKLVRVQLGSGLMIAEHLKDGR